MVECEYVNWSEVYKHADYVLIDTWWNVNPEWLTAYNEHSAF